MCRKYYYKIFRYELFLNFLKMFWFFLIWKKYWLRVVVWFFFKNKGLFSKIYYVLIVGVGSGVFYYFDGNKYVCLGDVVVFVFFRKNGVIYMYCDKIEKMIDVNGYNYFMWEWDCSDNLL